MILRKEKHLYESIDDVHMYSSDGGFLSVKNTIAIIVALITVSFLVFNVVLSSSNDSVFNLVSRDSPTVSEKVVYDSCQIPSSLEKCSHDLISVQVMGSNEGSWPNGVAWLLYKDFNEGGGKQLIYIEEGNFRQSVSIYCKKYVTNLCLHGQHVLFTNAESSSHSVTVCEELVGTENGIAFQVQAPVYSECFKHWSVPPINVKNVTFSLSKSLRVEEDNRVVSGSPVRSNVSSNVSGDASSTDLDRDEHRKHSPEIPSSYPTSVPTQPPECFLFGLVCTISHKASYSTGTPTGSPVNSWQSKQGYQPSQPPLGMRKSSYPTGSTSSSPPCFLWYSIMS